MSRPTYPFGNLIGQKFGHLLAVSAIETDPNTGDPVVYDCKCMKCGKEHIRVLDRDLVYHHVRSCGCTDHNDLAGMQFGRLIALEPAGRNDKGYPLYLCKCQCEKGTLIKVRIDGLTSGNSRSCGCIAKEKFSVVGRNRLVDLTGKKFGRLTVIRRANCNNKHACWECRCSCGNPNTVVVSSDFLKSGHTKSCGCIHRECARQVGLSNTKWNPLEKRILNHFDSMYKRCYNKNAPEYRNYGARGIYICNEWMEDRCRFVDWALKNGFKPGLTIDRINNDGPYAPWNCRWVDDYVQNNNKRTNHVIEVNGVAHTIAEWQRLSGINRGVLDYYASRGDDAFRNILMKRSPHVIVDNIV